MAVSLAPNQAPNGTLPGSPTKIIDVHTDSSNTRATLSIPIPASAQVGDFVGVFFGLGNSGATGLITGFTQIGPQFSTANWGPPGLHTASGAAALCFLWYIVQPGDPGTSSEWRWTQGNWMTWSIFSYTLRFVDTVSPIQVQGGGAQNDNVNNGTSTGSLSPTINNVLMIGAIEASAGVTTGINPGPTPAWIEQTGTGPAPTGSQPTAGMVSGALDQPLAGLWLGAGCLWAGGSPSGNLFVSYAGLAFGIKPTPAPGGPTVTLSPSGASIDTAGVSGVLFTVNWNYTPTRGQGPQNGWGIARQRHGVGDMVGFWNFDTHAWQSSQYINYGTRTSYTFGAGEWPNDGVNWDLFVFIQESALNYTSALSAAQTFVASPPTATVTVTGPTGTTASPTPAVTWTRSLGSGATQAFYRVKVFTQAQTLAGGFDPNVTVPVVDSTKTAGSALTWTLSKALVPGVYVAYAQLTTNFGQATLWTAGAAFTVSYLQPSGASVTALVGAGP